MAKGNQILAELENSVSDIMRNPLTTTQPNRGAPSSCECLSHFNSGQGISGNKELPEQEGYVWVEDQFQCTGGLYTLAAPGFFCRKYKIPVGYYLKLLALGTAVNRATAGAAGMLNVDYPGLAAWCSRDVGDILPFTPDTAGNGNFWPTSPAILLCPNLDLNRNNNGKLLPYTVIGNPGGLDSMDAPKYIGGGQCIYVWGFFAGNSTGELININLAIQGILYRDQQSKQESE